MPSKKKRTGAKWAKFERTLSDMIAKKIKKEKPADIIKAIAIEYLGDVSSVAGKEMAADVN